jgi:hypothetical protein
VFSSVPAQHGLKDVAPMHYYHADPQERQRHRIWSILYGQNINFCLLLQIREGSWEPTNIPLEDRLKQVSGLILCLAEGEISILESYTSYTLQQHTQVSPLSSTADSKQPRNIPCPQHPNQSKLDIYSGEKPLALKLCISFLSPSISSLIQLNRTAGI